MIETILGIFAIGFLLFLLLKAIGNILKGLLLLFLVFFIYYFLSFSLPSLNPSLQYFGNFLKLPINKMKSFFYNLEIVTVTQSKEGLVIVIRNNGILPLSNFNVKIDEKDAKIISNINILLPKQMGALEVEWKDSYSKVEVFTKETKAIYISPL
jgi:hypothetical protein